MSLFQQPARSFEFGLLLHTRHLVRGDDGSGGLEEFWEAAQLAETAGVDHLWLGDSPRLSMLDRAHADCLTVMAALAVKTRRVKIGTVPLIAALRNPVLLAHSLASLDVISGGRVQFAVSVAHQYKYAEYEFEACGVPYSQRAGRLDESIQVMRRLWAEESFSFSGRYYRFPQIGIQPKPVRGSIPVWIAAGDNENALKRSARLGDGWFTVAHTAEEFLARRKKIDTFAHGFGREVQALPAALFATFHLHRDEEKAEQEGWQLAESYFRQPRSALHHLSPFFSTPQECANRLQAYVDAGLTAVVARIVSPDVENQVRLLLQEVKPRLRSG
jgi:alkanesulfonate monooxygenase SsuD/methylene tetrahydromethanopterin reductase-like flavin-dependent oxidoreductase (luciferase family)